ncbi:MAG TPA: HAMP domain-containing sensor histidine kinase [Rhodocyclaceae bacterium]|nr:HAMP domain-containing sensor histidine kinase [Rhodocyclaceae bacterium]
MLAFGRHLYSISCRGIAVTGRPRHAATFIQDHLCLLKWASAAAIALWTVTLVSHLKYALDGFHAAAIALGYAPEYFAPVLVVAPIVLGVCAALYLLVRARGRLTTSDAQRLALLSASGVLACEGLQLGLTHGQPAHLPSYTLANLILFAIAPLKPVQQFGLAAFSLTLPVIVALITGYPAAESLPLLALMTLPLSAVVLGIIALYWRYGSFRLRKLAELRLARRTVEVERQKRELERRRQAEQRRIQWLEQMARFLRHELRNALVGATTSLMLLQRRSNIQENDEYLARARQALRVIGALLESVSEATSIESTLMKEKTEAVRLQSLVQEQLATYRTIYPKQAFTLDTDGEELIVSGQAERFIEMLDNLVSNAVDHADAGTEIVMCCRRNKARAVIKVINKGPPIFDTLTIFEPFSSFRDQANSDGHLGIGLYMVKLIAERYGGRVEARNRSDIVGVEFRVALPVMA